MSKLLKKVLLKRTFLIPTDTLSREIRYLQELYSKLAHSRNAKIKRFSTLPTRILITLDESYDTYVDFNDGLESDIYVYNMLFRKASC